MQVMVVSDRLFWSILCIVQRYIKGLVTEGIDTCNRIAKSNRLNL